MGWTVSQNIKGPSGGEVLPTGQAGPPRTIADFSQAAGSYPASGSAFKAYWWRSEAGHGYSVNVVGIEVAISADSISLGIMRQDTPGGEFTSGTVLSSTGLIPCPAVGFGWIPLDVAVTISVPTDWFGLSGTGATHRIRGQGSTASSGNGFLPFARGSVVGSTHHPITTAGNFTEYDGGHRFPQILMIGDSQ